MKVLLFTPLGEKNFMRNARWDTMGISGSQWYPIYLAYCTGLLEKHGHECKLVDCQVDDIDVCGIWDIAHSFQPDLVVVQFSSRVLKNDMMIASEVKKATGMKCKVALVGASSSLIDKELVLHFYSPYIDHIIEGEYDYPILDLANGEELDEVIISKPVTSEQLSEFPFVTDVYKRHLTIKNYRQTAHKYPYIDLFTGRGCDWGHCTFCLYPHTLNKGAGYRTRDIASVIAELKYIKEKIPEIKEVFIQDDTLPEWRALEFSNAILDNNLKLTWSCYARANLSYMVLDMMKRAGCRTMHVGYESSNNVILKGIRKGITKERMEQFTYDAHKIGLNIVADFITGLPFETERTVRETVEWAKGLPVQRYTITLPKPYPHTPFYDYLVEHNELDSNGHPDYSEDGYKGLAAKDIYELNKWSVREVYMTPRYILRMLKQPSEWDRIARSAAYLLPFLRSSDKSCAKENLEW